MPIDREEPAAELPAGSVLPIDPARTIFLEAVERHALDEWPAFVAQACGGNEPLRREVLRLLEAHAQIDGFMARPAAAAAPPPELPPNERVGGQIGRYKLLEQIGEGGMGIVYAAEQTEPVRRKVALKIIKPGMDSRQIIARFEAERQALALMDHPHIARILDAGTLPLRIADYGLQMAEPEPLQIADCGLQIAEPDAAPNPQSEIPNPPSLPNPQSEIPNPQSPPLGRPYFVMELVRGLPITDYCDQARLDPRQRLELFITVCQAVQHAHQKGVIHRDLKPSNILVTMQDGVAVPKVIDFGVAKAIGQRLSEHTVHTGFMQMLGTPLYMSPEQAELTSADIDTRSDVYSLGVLLYELLTGHTPFDRDTLRQKGFDELRRMIREDDPPRPSQRISTLDARAGSTIAAPRGLDHRRLGQTLRGELDWIVMKALEKDRARRYESSGALAADVRRYLDNLPIHARPASLLTRARKWRRRHPATFLAGVASAFLLAAAIAASLWHNQRLARELAVTEQLRQEGFERETALWHEKYYDDIRLAWEANARGDLAEVRRLLDLYQPRPDEPDVTGFEWHYLRHRSQPPVRTLTGHQGLIWSVDASPDGQYVASGDAVGEIRICEIATGRLVKSLRDSEAEVNSICFSPDGRWLAAGYSHPDKTIRVWSVGNWQPVATLTQHDGSVYGLAWSPDSQRLASAGRGDRTACIWNMASRSLERSLPHSDELLAVDWSPDGKLLATAESAKGIRLWDTKSWADLGLLPWNDEDNIQCVAFSPDSKLLVAGGWGGQLGVFDTSKRERLYFSDVGFLNASLVFLDQYHFLAGHCFADGDGEIRLYRFDYASNTLLELHRRSAGGGRVRGIVLANGGRTVLTTCEDDKTVTIWDGPSIYGRTSAPYQWPEGYLYRHGLVLTPGKPGEMILNHADRREVARFDYKHGGKEQAVPNSLDLLAIPQPDGTIGLFHLVEERMQSTIPPAAKGPLMDLSFSPDDRWLAGYYERGVAGVWHVATGQWHPLLNGPKHDRVPLAWSPTANHLALNTSAGNEVQVWDVERRTQVTSIKLGANVKHVVFIDGGKTLAIGQEDGKISLWDAVTGAGLTTLAADSSPIRELALSPDGRTLASHSHDHTVRLWHVGTRRELFTLSQGIEIAGFCFNPDGSLEITNAPRRPLMFYPGSGYRPPLSSTPR